MNLIIWIRNLLLLGLLSLGVLVGCSPVGFDTVSNKSCEEQLAAGEVDSCETVTPDSVLRRKSTTLTVQTPKVDILFVIDNSSSMLTEQQKIGNAFPNFISSLDSLNVDWQVGVTTMDVSRATRTSLRESPTLNYGESYYDSNFSDNEAEGLVDGNLLTFDTGRKYLKKGEASASSLNNSFSQRVYIPNQGTHDERGIMTAKMALSKGNGTLFRSVSKHTAIVFLSDEDNRSTGEANGYDMNADNDCDPLVDSTSEFPMPSNISYYCLKTPDTKESFLSYWDTTVNSTNNKTLSVHSIVIPSGNTSCLNTQNNQPLDTASYGKMYESLSNNTSSEGIIGNICASNYTNELQNMGNFIGERSRKQVVLPISSNCSLVTDDPENPIVIEFTKNGVTYTFNYGEAPAAGSGITSVVINGNTLEFTPALPAGSTVSPSYAELCTL